MPNELIRLEAMLTELDREVRRLRAWQQAVSAGGLIRASSIVGVIPPANGGTGTDGDTIVTENLILKAGAEQTIAGGVITAPDSVRFPVDTEIDAASDDLDTINGGTTGELIVIYPADGARTIVVKHGTGNILCVGNVDITLDDGHDWALLLYNGSNWWAR